jgi:predicted DNA-binding transcriptional regulator YafY
VYDSTSIANYIDNTANAANVEALVDGIKRKKQVVLRQYESAHSDGAKDRLVEPIEFTANMIDIWAYDVDNGDNRVFKVARIHEVEVTDADWAFKTKHKVLKPDVFRMTGPKSEKVALQLNTRAKSLLLEEYPLAEKDLKRVEGTWVLATTIHSMEGVGRFVIGLAADIKILEGDTLKKYIQNYQKKYIQKL